MTPALIDAATIAGSLGLFAAAYLIVGLATRPARVSAAPATPDLGEEPPAVVNLLANRWRLTRDAAEATLLDLAARGYLELRQPGNDPMQTTIHLPKPGKDSTGLLPYERRVLERVRTLAVKRVLPVTALTFRDSRRADQWHKRLAHEVVTEARARGLSRRRFGPLMITVLTGLAGLSGAGVATAAMRIGARAQDWDPISLLGTGIFTWMTLSAIAGRPSGERHTPHGQRVAARWLGVRDWLRAHEQFADLPPASIAVWDRYLPYGAALGVTSTTSAVLDLGMGDRRQVWSSYGGRWRRVRVRYPRWWRRYGRSVPSLVTRSVIALAIGGVLVRWHGLPVDSMPFQPASGVPLELVVLSRVALVTGVLLLAYGAYVLCRSLLDLATTRAVTGEVLWMQPWKTRSGGQDRPPVVWLDYLAVDSGDGERTVAWGLPRDQVASCKDRDEVTIRVRPWSRRVVHLALVRGGRTRRLVDRPVDPMPDVTEGPARPGPNGGSDDPCPAGRQHRGGRTGAVQRRIPAGDAGHPPGPGGPGSGHARPG